MTGADGRGAYGTVSEMAPKVSVCIPAYGDPEGVGRALDSLLYQRLPEDAPDGGAPYLEVIVSDDTGDTSVREAVRARLEQFGRRGIPLRYVHNDAPLGAVPNWNAALSMARGEYVQLLHHDDYYTFEDSLVSLVLLLDGDRDAVLAFCGTRQADTSAAAAGDETARDRFGLPFYTRAASREDAAMIAADAKALFLGNVIGAPSAVMVRRDMAVSPGAAYDEALTWLVDEDYYMQLLESVPHFAWTDRPLMTIGTGEGQLTNRVSSDRALVMREHIRVFRKHGLAAADAAACGRHGAHMAEVLASCGAQASDIPADLGISREALAGAKRKEARAARTRRLDTAVYLFRKVQDALHRPAVLLCLTGILIETLVVLADMSDANVAAESHIFRLTFCMFGVKMLCTPRPKKAWLRLAFFLALGLVSYRACGRNEILRAVVFVAALRDLDMRRVMRAVLAVMGAGSAAIVLLSALGIWGVRRIEADMGHGMEMRWCLGFGHPNALHCMALMLLLMGLYLYGTRLKARGHLVLFVLNAALYLLTRSNSGFFIASLAILASLLFAVRKSAAASPAPYVFGTVLLFACLAFSFAAAIWGYRISLIRVLDGIMTGRVKAVWDTNYHEGTFASWRWFSDRESRRYFDMGWIRLFYWYGAAPAGVIVCSLVALLARIRERRDRAALVLTAACCMYTVVEAHLVSVYLLRDPLLLLAAAYLPLMCPGDSPADTAAAARTSAEHARPAPQ